MNKELHVTQKNQIGDPRFKTPFFLFRLVRGEGEIIEEIVSKEKHKEINKVNLKLSLYLM